jgi:hypothetical protein
MFRYGDAPVLADTLFIVQFSISLGLKDVISTSIVLLLIHHQQLVTQALGKVSGGAYLNAMTILVESASLIVLIDVLAFAVVLPDSSDRSHSSYGHQFK